MASTLKVTLSEECNIEGVNYGGIRTKTYSTITSVYKHIISVSTTSATILNFADAAGDVGTLDRDSIEYLRITNLDDTNFVILGFEKETSTASGYWVKVDAGRSFIVPVSNTTTEHPDFSVNDSGHAVASYGEIESITAKANTAACNIEIMVAMNG